MKAYSFLYALVFFRVAEVFAALRLHGPTNASVCHVGMGAILILAKDNATVAYLKNAGACAGTFI